MKTVMMVRHANGDQEKLCPKCGMVMTFHEGGSVQRMGIGEVYEEETADAWNCDTCGFYEDEATDRYFERVFCGA